jgi:hypothetical protein
MTARQSQARNERILIMQIVRNSSTHRLPETTTLLSYSLKLTLVAICLFELKFRENAMYRPV